MKRFIKKILRSAGVDVVRYDHNHLFEALFMKYNDLTMIDRIRFIDNLRLCSQFCHLEGDYAECGVWKGGMSGAISEVIGGQKKIYLFDSFEGLPPARDIDGRAALNWQADTASSAYHNNCAAGQEFALTAMKRAGRDNYEVHAGWFSKTLPAFRPAKLAILRLDGDWYDSITVSLKYLYPMVVENGLIILDDYTDWTGCSKAVHQYLAAINSSSRLSVLGTVTYIVKKEVEG